MRVVKGLVALSVIAHMLYLGGTAQADLPCGKGGNRAKNEAMARCLSKKPGLRVQTSKAIRIGQCESGFYAHAGAGSTYQGIYQLGRDEFDTFQHQGPKWVDQEFRDLHYGILSARGNVLAAFAHAHRFGWSAWSCQ